MAGDLQLKLEAIYKRIKPGGNRSEVKLEAIDQKVKLEAIDQRIKLEAIGQRIKLEAIDHRIKPEAIDRAIKAGGNRSEDRAGEAPERMLPDLSREYFPEPARQSIDSLPSRPPT